MNTDSHRMREWTRPQLCKYFENKRASGADFTAMRQEMEVNGVEPEEIRIVLRLVDSADIQSLVSKEHQTQRTGARLAGIIIFILAVLLNVYLYFIGIVSWAALAFLGIGIVLLISGNSNYLKGFFNAR